MSTIPLIFKHKETKCFGTNQHHIPVSLSIDQILLPDVLLLKDGCKPGKVHRVACLIHMTFEHVINRPLRGNLEPVILLINGILRQCLMQPCFGVTEDVRDWTDLSACPQHGKLRTDGCTICSTKLASESDPARCMNRLTAAQICHALYFTW